MDYRDWEILKVLHNQKNLTKAAKLLYITQPALTNRLKQIQEEVGAKIITRESRGIQFTPQGEYLVRCAEEALSHYQKIKENVTMMNSQKNNEVIGTLKLGVSIFFANYKLPYILKLFKMKYPHVKFKVITGWSKDVSQFIYNKDVHIGFVRGDYALSSLSRHLLFDETICIASKDKIDLSKLPQLPRINYRGDYLLKSLIDKWWMENYGQEPFNSLEVDQIETCKQMIINGLGYGILASGIFTGGEDLNLIELTDQKGNPIVRKTWMYYHEESLDWNVAREFIKFVEELDWMKNE